MGLATKEKLEAMRQGETILFPYLEFSATFGDERVLQSGVSLGTNFDRFIAEHPTYDIRVEGDYVAATRR